MKTKIYLIFLTTTLFATFSHADIFTWTGLGGDGLWQTVTNWDDGIDTPANNDYSDIALFGTSATAGTVGGSGTSVNEIRFATTGWNLTVDIYKIKKITTLSGSGTNTLTKDFEIPTGSTGYINVAAGTQLNADSGWRQNSQNLVVQGGGTVFSGGQSLSYSYNSAHDIRIQEDSLLRMDVTSPFNYPTLGTIKLYTSGSRFEYKGSVTDAENMILAGQITNESGSGSLMASSLGSGFTQISVIPEPSTAALLLLSGLTAICVLRKRK